MNKLVVFAAFLMFPVNLMADNKVAQHLQDISVTIVSKSASGSGGEGSGVIKTRKTANGDCECLVWTAAHVISNLRHTKNVVDSKSGSTKTVVEFDDALVVKTLVEDGRNVGKIEFYAEVLRYSADEDLALLKVRKKNYVQTTVEFYLDKEIPAIGTQLFHVGSLLGTAGSNSMTSGIMSQHGRLIDKKVFDQQTAASFAGSSGGGVYLTDGKCIGLVVRGAGETFVLIVPVRRMHEWAKQAKIEWAMNDAIPMPTEEELKKLPVEDNGVEFSYSARADGAKVFGHGFFHLGTEDPKYPTFFKIND